jgi:drug/metabolite transporter (DMT)-like permease
MVISIRFRLFFFRALFGSVLMFPIFLIRKERLKTQYPFFHMSRILLGVSAVTLACYSTALFSLPEVTTLSFSQPLLFLPLAFFFLGEKITFPRLLANILGFIGVFVVLSPENREFFHIATLVPLASASLFAILDIQTKKYSLIESPLTLIFYFNIGVTLIAGLMSISVWETPSLSTLFWLILLGASATFIQFSSFMSLAATGILALAPLRYAELLISCCVGIFLFSEFPTLRMLLGGLLIIAGVFYVTRVETAPIKERQSD